MSVVAGPSSLEAQDGRALAVNARFADCSPAIVLGPRDIVSFAGAAAGAIFAEALVAMRGDSSAGTLRKYSRVEPIGVAPSARR